MMTDHKSGLGRSPTVSVVCPFFGNEEDARRLVRSLTALSIREGDELIVADNTPDGVFARIVADAPIAVVRATEERSSYHARNVGAMRASGDWLLFTDADCVPPADLITTYLAEPIEDGVGILAGPVTGSSEQEGLLPEWAATRGVLSHARSIAAIPPAAATANMMVLRELWWELGGFLEGCRSGADFEFCWRAADAGYGIAFREDAAVEHIHRASLRAIGRQMARYAAGNAWQRRRRGGYPPPAKALRALGRSGAGAAGFAVSMQGRRARLKLVDGLAACAQFVGRGLRNTVVGPVRPSPARLVIATDRFPVPSETFIAGEIDALRRLGSAVRVEAVARPDRPRLGGTHGIDVRYMEDEAALARAGALAWVAIRHPLRFLGDFAYRTRFSADERVPMSVIAPMARRLAVGRERHVHVHFAALAAVNALRAARLVGVGVSIAAHGHELFKTPKAIPAKLTEARFVAAPCEYTAREIRRMAPDLGRVEVVVMGVDGETFRRRRPYPGGRTVVAVGRLVEKKGFADLIDAVAILGSDRIERVRIVGDGHLRRELEERIERGGLTGLVELPGALDADAVRGALEEGDVMVVPCVIATDGDRDAMPVVAKEALAMELPVVGTREVGLPEVIKEDWGRLVPPGNAAALAGAIDELLSLPPETRAQMGRRGRAWTLEQFDQLSQARKLLGLIRAS